MKALGLIILSFLFLGCSTVPVQNIENELIAPAKTKEHVKGVITRVAKSRRWKVSEKNENTLRAKLFARKHEVTVDITYSGSSFSISYVDSRNMRYDGEIIHKKYMAWIHALRRDILRKM